LKRSARAAAAVALSFTITACAALPPRRLAVEHASPPAVHGPLRDMSDDVETRLESGDSAHWLLDRNQLALSARLALTDAAASTLDIQYFIWQDDASGHLLEARVLAAADRGIKVRLMLDDFAVLGRRDELVRLDAHPNIEVRLFNPWAARRTRVGRALEFLRRPRQLNRRMHNKAYIADGRFAVIGGRNIGDRYFGLFKPWVQDDLDVLLEGPVVADVVTSFDRFWNGASTYPARAFLKGEADDLLASARRDIAEHLVASAAVLSSFPTAGADWSRYLGLLDDTLIAGPAELYDDLPLRGDTGGQPLYAAFKQFVASAEREVLISSPYFIPDREFRELLRSLVARGVRVRVLTNSLATNNHVVAHTGYRRWRREVLRSGVELYELRADAAALALYVTPPVMSKALGLHSKAVVVDGRRAFVGSPNIDPRSMVLNTEIGVATESSELAARVGALIERDMAPANAWRVTLDSHGRLSWTDDEQTVRRQPAKGFRQRVVEFLLNLIPLKKQV
jgi:putative cardiolipin synthase